MLRSFQNVITAEYRKLLNGFRSEIKDQKPFTEVKKAMKLKFRMKMDWDKEDGYRYLEVFITTPRNYTAVVVRQTWNIADIAKDDGKYVDGKTDFFLLAYHDSCWTDGIYNVLKSALSLDSDYSDWYEIVDVDFDIGEMEEINKVDDMDKVVFRFN